MAFTQKCFNRIGSMWLSLNSAKQLIWYSLTTWCLPSHHCEFQCDCDCRCCLFAWFLYFEIGSHVLHGNLEFTCSYYCLQLTIVLPQPLRYHYTLYTIRYTLYTIHLYTIRYMLYTIRYTLYPICYTLYLAPEWHFQLFLHECHLRLLIIINWGNENNIIIIAICCVTLGDLWVYSSLGQEQEVFVFWKLMSCRTFSGWPAPM